MNKKIKNRKKRFLAISWRSKGGVLLVHYLVGTAAWLAADSIAKYNIAPLNYQEAELEVKKYNLKLCKDLKFEQYRQKCPQ